MKSLFIDKYFECNNFKIELAINVVNVGFKKFLFN
jgi:hypothetical protein